jgi:hypothetical protein
MSTYEQMSTKMDEALRFLESIKTGEYFNGVEANVDRNGLVDRFLYSLDHYAMDLKHFAFQPNIAFPKQLREKMIATSSEMMALSASVRLVRDNVQGVM